MPWAICLEQMSIQLAALPSYPCRIPFMSTPSVAPFSSIRLDKSSPNPIYLQIAEGIGELLKSGVLPAGYVLPPERALCEQFGISRSEEHTSELQSQSNLVCRLLLEKKKRTKKSDYILILSVIRSTS